MTDQQHALNLAVKQLSYDVARKLNLEKKLAILGDENGVIYNPANPASGLVYVREKTSNGLSTPKLVRGPYAGATVTMRPGVPVELEYDKDGYLYIARISFQDSLVAGSNPIAANASDQAANSFVNQSSITTLLSTPTAPPSTSVALRGWKPVVSGTFYDFPGALVDMSSFIPAANMHRVAIIFVKSDYATVEVKASTAKSTSDPIMPADIQEAITARTAGSVPTFAWRLHDAQTTIVDADKFLDLRQAWNTNDGPGSGTVTSVGSGAGLSGGPITSSGTLLATPAFLIPARVASGSNVNTASPGASIDGLSLSAGDRVLLTAQSTGSQNGLWTWNGAAVAMTRPVDFASGSTVLAYQNIFVYVVGGATYTGEFFSMSTSGTVTIDTTSQAWSAIVIAAANLSNALVVQPSTSTRNRIIPSADVIGLVARRFSAGATSDLQEWQDESGTALALVDKGGNIQGNIFKFPTAVSSTLSGNAFTVTKAFHVLSASTGTADSLVTINGGAGVEFIILQAASTHTITVKNGTGNIFLNGGSDFSLSGDKTLALFYDGTNWSDWGAGGGGGGGGTVSTTVESVYTEEIIYDNTLGADGSWDVSGIASSYDTLRILLTIRSAGAVAVDNGYLYFNNDTTDANYSNQNVYGNNGTPFAGNSANRLPLTVVGDTQNANLFTAVEVMIPDYAGSTYKGYWNIANEIADTAGNSYSVLTSSTWKSTSAISRVTVKSLSGTSGNFKSGSRIQIIGIKTLSVVTAVNGSASIAFTESANGTVANTAAETTVLGTVSGSKTLSAGLLSVAGRYVRFKAWGFVSDTGTPTLQLKLKFGSTVILDSGAVTLGSGISNKLWWFEGAITTQTAGATGKLYAQGQFYQNGTTTDIVSTAQISIDLTASLVVDLTATWSAGSPSNTITCTDALFEYLN